MRTLPLLTILAIAVAAIALLGLGLSVAGLHGGVPVYVSVAGLALAIGMVLPSRLGAFLRFFLVFYSIGYLALMALFLIAPLLPAALSALIPPGLTGFTAAAFGLLALLLARVPVVAEVFSLADPYFETKDRGSLKLWLVGQVNAPEKWIAFTMLSIIILINLGQVGVSVRLSYWSRDWLDAIQNKDAAEFWRQLYQIWMPWVGVLILSNMIEFVIVSNFKIRWREWMTTRAIARWMDDATHYRLQFQKDGVDNPDQRIQEDVRKYIEINYSLSISMIQQISTLVSFSFILWGLSAALTIPGTDQKLPGLLFWVALLYAGLGTVITDRIGRKLIRLNFVQETYEADFRFSLARLREYAESIALLGGERAEKGQLSTRFGDVIRNFFAIVRVQKWLSAFIQLYGSSNSVIPYVIAAPFYFVGQITLGVLNQTAGAFSRVDAALAFVIDRYTTLAEYKAVADRLNGFNRAIDAAQVQKIQTGIRHEMGASGVIRVPDLTLLLPDGRKIAHITQQDFKAGETVLVIGPSGSGKSTLFRAIAGIWPFGQGVINRPEGESVLLLPQRPYIPIGSLKDAVSYPALPGAYADGDLVAALEAVQLSALLPRLEEKANWSQILSGGEQQRLAVARALLAKPRWLLLDEATSALDEPLEASIYAMLKAQLQGTTLISIGHRSTLIDLHDRVMRMEKGGDGLFALLPGAVKN
jgi:vitamin B12/bleomycin/antimicrobial peptide transport system ATP-binding/permease protein